MKKGILGIIPLAIVFSSALAEKNQPKLCSKCPPSKWCPYPKAFQGVYGGINVGYGTANIRTVVSDSTVPDYEKYKLTAQGADGGVLLGYNHIFSPALGLGIEAYFNWTSAKGNYFYVQPDLIQTRTIQLKNALQIRVPISYVFREFLAPKIYAGWDSSSWVSSINWSSTTTGTNKSRYNGVLWGAGVDVLLTEHIISGLEYTGVLSQNKNFTAQSNNIAFLQYRPLYNTFKITLKVIY